METRKLHVALLISGHPRTWKEGCEWVNKYFRPKFKKVDVYFHLWDTIDAQSTWWCENRPVAKCSTPLEEICRSLKPECGSLDNIYKKEFHRSRLEAIWVSSNTKPFHVLSQWYSLWRVWCLMKESGAKYDMVVRHRLDIDAQFEIHSKFEDGVVVGCRNSRWVKQDNRKAVCDCHAYGCMEAMEKYCSLYPVAEELLTHKIAGRANKHRMILHPEFALAHYLKKEGVLVFEDKDYTRIINRVDGSTKEL